MGNSTQVLCSVRFGRQWVCCGVTRANYLNFVSFCTAYLQLKFLSLVRRRYQFSFCFIARSDLGIGNLIEVRHCMVNNYLNAKMRTTVVEFDECKEIALFTSSAGPTGNFNNMIKILFMRIMKCGYSDAPSITEIRHRLFLNRGISHHLILNLTLVPCILRSWTITISTCWLTLSSLCWFKRARSSFPLSLLCFRKSSN